MGNCKSKGANVSAEGQPPHKIGYVGPPGTAATAPSQGVVPVISSAAAQQLDNNETRLVNETGEAPAREQQDIVYQEPPPHKIGYAVPPSVAATAPSQGSVPGVSSVSSQQLDNNNTLQVNESGEATNHEQQDIVDQELPPHGVGYDVPPSVATTALSQEAVPVISSAAAQQLDNNETLQVNESGEDSTHEQQDKVDQELDDMIEQHQRGETSLFTSPKITQSIRELVHPTKQVTLMKTGHSDPEFFRRHKIPVSINTQTRVLKNCGAFHQLGSFAVKGQGAVGFKCLLKNDVKEVQFRFDPNECEEGSAHPVLHRIDNRYGWTVTDLVTKEVLVTAKSDHDLPILNNGRHETFWMSFDKENLILRGGTGYMLTALQLFEKSFKNRTHYLKRYGELSVYSMYKPQDVLVETVEKVTSKYPIYNDLPPIVKDHNEITLEDLDTRAAISIKELSPECQRLYENMAGKNIKINPPDFPDFAQAIDYSINHGKCKRRLKEKLKRGEFGKTGEKNDANQNYLRITLGSNMGDSPGIPYVMEIWPAGCYSPIHDHSQANAIIKVLHGSLTTRWFESLDRVQQQQDQPHGRKETAEPYDQAIVAEGDVTWLDDRQFQTHQLFNHNVGGTACITIQCYMYNNTDNSHYENFDYIGADDDVHAFEPDSDWDYSDFKEKMKEEFSEYKKKAVPKPDMRKTD